MVKEDEDMDEVIPSLFLGNASVAQNVSYLMEHKVTHILNVSDKVFEVDHGMKFCHVSMCDHGNSDLPTVLPKCFEFLEECLTHNHKILVHCQIGANRSPTVVISYLMKYHNMDLKTCCEKVKQCRECVWPVEPYIKQLIDYELTLRPVSSASFEELKTIFRSSCVNRFKSDLFKAFKQPEYDLQSDQGDD